MGLLSWLFESSEDDNTSEIDTDLLYPVAEQWLREATQEDDELSEYKWEAVQHVEKESRGGFWLWLWGE